MIRYQDVFVPGGFPQHTYNPRDPLQLESRLNECRNNLCKLVTVTGHTKSGKTVLARKVLSSETSVWIDGGAVSQEEDFWQLVIEQLELFQGTHDQTLRESSTTVGAKASAGANFIVAKGTGELAGSLSGRRTRSATQTRTLSSRVAALRGLAKSRTPLVVDDFHYMPPAVQGNVVRALKSSVFDGLPVVIIAIPHRRYDAIKVEREMTGRIVPIEIPAWTPDELQFIPETGFRLLNHTMPAELARKLADEAIGSPHLMQDFCRAICGVRALTVDSPGALRLAQGELHAVFREVAQSIGRPIFERLARGPRQRTDRLPRQLKDGRTVDIYELVLHGLAHLRPGLSSLEYEELRASIRDVSASQIPQLHEVARVLKHMATIAASDQSSTPVIDFEEAEKRLHITDPFFAFYLRWGDLAASDGPPALPRGTPSAE